MLTYRTTPDRSTLARRKDHGTTRNALKSNVIYVLCIACQCGVLTRPPSTSRFGPLLAVLGIIDPDVTRAEAQIAAKNNAGVPGYASAAVWPTPEAAGQALAADAAAAIACCADIEFCASGNKVGEASGEVELEPKLSRLSMLVASAMAPPPPDALLALPFRPPRVLDTGGSASNQLAVGGGTIGRGCWLPNASEKSSSEKTGRSSGAGGGGGGRFDADRPLFL